MGAFRLGGRPIFGLVFAVQPACESDLPLVWHPCQFIVGRNVGDDLADWVNPHIRLAGLVVDAGSDYGVPVADVNEFNVFAGAGRPPQPGLDAEPANAGLGAGP